MAQVAKRKEWKSLGSDKEIIAENGYDDKTAAPTVDPQSKVLFTARREIFIKRRSQHNYVTKDANEDSKDVRGIPQQNSVWEVLRLESDTGVQAVHDAVESASQTPYFRKVHACVQAQPTLVDARLQPGKEDPNMDPNMKKFLDKVMPRMLHHLVQNAEVPIVGDDYMRLADEDTFVGSREDSVLKEAGNYQSVYIKDRYVTSLDWATSSKSMIAVTTIQNKTLRDRIEQSLRCESHVCLVWNFTDDQMHPQFILEAPHEIQVVRFNPTNPNIIIGGCMNGQVVEWNVQRVLDAKQAKTTKRVVQFHSEQQDVREIPPMPQPIRGHTLERDGDADISRLQPSKVSRIEASHKYAVNDICWVPDGAEFLHNGRIRHADERTKGRQFATISTDGCMFVWDLDPRNLHSDKVRKMNYQSKSGGEEVPWIPMLKFPLVRPDGTGEVLGLRLHLEGFQNNVPTYVMTCTTVDGELCVCNIAPKEDRAQQQQFHDNKPDNRVVRAMMPAHAGPVLSIRPHPQIPDIYLTCGDWGFKVWRLGLPTPILSSPNTSSKMMCAQWSPTRPAVIFIGTGDGRLQVWDLLDRSHEPGLVLPVFSDPITSLEFRPMQEKKGQSQLLSLGTKKGSLNLFTLPRSLTKGHHNERQAFRAMIDREVQRVSYFQWRWRERQKEIDRLVQDKGGEVVVEKKKEGEEENDDDDDFFVTVDTEVEFNSLVKQLEAANAEDESL